MNETPEIGVKKLCAAVNIKMFSMQKPVNYYVSPPTDIIARGVKIKVKDLN